MKEFLLKSTVPFKASELVDILMKLKFFYTKLYLIEQHRDDDLRKYVVKRDMMLEEEAGFRIKCECILEGIIPAGTALTISGKSEKIIDGLVEVLRKAGWERK